ncbi:MAG: class E sortase [Actinobacteria bacterium]|nr:class E sortase [Actinomycetota bacterium]
MALRFIGRTFIGLGALILLFLAYQLVGTNFVTSREQSALAGQLEEQWTTGIDASVPDPGDAYALMQIPKIDLDVAVVEGVSVADLKKGPGHYPGSAVPGGLGNFVVSGHRTTYGGPFGDLDKVEIGDEITVIDRNQKVHKYVVSETKIVLPSEVGVIARTDEARLTLTTCHPKFSARERLIVVADLVGTPGDLQQTEPTDGEIVDS